jgi:glycosyltransferase involved in cell wall biosynthesis
VRVCLIAENHPLVLMGGAEYQTQLLAEELSRRPGVALHYLARRVPQGTAATNLPYAVRCIGSDRGVRRRAVFFDAPELWRTLRELQPDVIYQQAKQSYTAVCAHYSRRTGIPFFYQIASDYDLDRHWLSLMLSRLSANTPFDIVESVSGNWGILHASHVIAQTAPQAQILRSRFGRDATAVIRNFQPLPNALPRKPAGPVRVLWVANLKYVKRPELFVQLARSFVGRKDLQFIMVGRPAMHWRYAALMNEIPTLGNLEYLGEQPIERVNELMAQAHIHVNTSSFEGFPNTFIQAWARGAVVMSIAVDPDGDMESRGIGFCAGSFDRLRTLVDELAATPQRRQEIAQRAFEFAQAEHSLASGARLADLMLDAVAGTASDRNH